MADRISVSEYLKDNSLLQFNYIPYDKKIDIVSHVFSGVIQAVGGLNSTLLRMVKIEAIIENVTNLDLKIPGEDDLKGLDLLIYTNELPTLIQLMGREYEEFDKMFEEYTADYIRMETNPAVTIEAIYNRIAEQGTVIIDFLQEQIKNVDVEQFSSLLLNVIQTQAKEKNNEH